MQRFRDQSLGWARQRRVDAKPDEDRGRNQTAFVVHDLKPGRLPHAGQTASAEPSSDCGDPFCGRRGADKERPQERRRTQLSSRSLGDSIASPSARWHWRSLPTTPRPSLRYCLKPLRGLTHDPVCSDSLGASHDAANIVVVDGAESLQYLVIGRHFQAGKSSSQDPCGVQPFFRELVCQQCHLQHRRPSSLFPFKWSGSLLF